MASEQAMEAAQNIANVEGWEDDANLEEIAEIIDAAFAELFAERDALRMKLGSQANEIAGLNRAIEQWRESDGILRERLGLK